VWPVQLLPNPCIFQQIRCIFSARYLPLLSRPDKTLQLRHWVTQEGARDAQPHLVLSLDVLGRPTPYLSLVIPLVRSTFVGRHPRPTKTL